MLVKIKAEIEGDAPGGDQHRKENKHMVGCRDNDVLSSLTAGAANIKDSAAV